MSIQILDEQTPRARKHHRCNDCGGWIVPGEVYHLQKNACDGSAYSWKQHFDCRAMSNENVKNGYAPDYWHNGIPPLHEDDGVMDNLNAWRGHYPHVVCRIELQQQLSNARWERKKMGQLDD